MPTLLYGCQIWSLLIISHKYELEKIQHKFLRYIAHKLYTPTSMIDHDAYPILYQAKITWVWAPLRWLYPCVYNLLDTGLWTKMNFATDSYSETYLII